MKHWLLIWVLVLVSCKDAKPVNAPANLISEEKMSAIIADFAISDQMGYLNNPDVNMEVSSRYVLEKHKVSSKAFSDSYKYYLASPRELEKIMDEAQEIILKQDSEAEKYIDKKLKENTLQQPK